MQALLLIAIFSLFLSVVSGIITQSGGNTALTKRLRVEETELFFKGLDIVMNDMTVNRLEVAPATVTDAAELIRSEVQLRQLSSGRWDDPATDAWGVPLTGIFVREPRVIYSDGSPGPNNKVIAPVTGIALISSGPNRTFDVAIPPNPGNISSLQAILPLEKVETYPGSGVYQSTDDLVRVFTDEGAQRRNWEIITQHLQRIAGAELRYFQDQMTAYRKKVYDKYVTDVAADPDTPMPDIAALVATDPDAPRFMDLNEADDNNRRLLGVDDDFAFIERELENGGRLRVGTFNNTGTSIDIQVTNDPDHPTPWGNGAGGGLNYTITVKGTVE